MPEERSFEEGIQADLRYCRIPAHAMPRAVTLLCSTRFVRLSVYRCRSVNNFVALQKAALEESLFEFEKRLQLSKAPGKRKPSLGNLAAAAAAAASSSSSSSSSVGGSVAAPGSAASDASGTGFDGEQEVTAEQVSRLRTLCVEFVQLRQFVHLNAEGFRKLLKKHRKRTGYTSDPRLEPASAYKQPFADPASLAWFGKFA